MTLPIRPGMTLPLPGHLHAQRDRLIELADLGYTDVWSAESDGADAFTPLALAAAWEPRLRLGTAIVPAFTRAPACMAQSVAAMADAAPGRFAFGVGSSSNVIVERWNGVPFVEPYKRVRDVVRFLKDAFSGEKVSHEVRHVRGAGLPARGAARRWRRSVLVAALRPGMLRLAGREADGAIINWLSADDVAKVAPVVRDAAGGEDREIVCRIFVCPSEDTDTVRAGRQVRHRRLPERAGVRRSSTSGWAGATRCAPMWEAWQAGDRKAAIAAIPDSLVDELIVHGSPAACRAQIQRYFDNGVTTSSLAIMPLAPLDHGQAIRDLAPSAG